MENKKILSKLAAVATDVDYIQKDPKNDKLPYRYASERKIKEHLHKAFVKHGVIMQMNVATPIPSGNVVYLPVEYVFWDVESGETISGNFVGAGHTRDDKGIYAAITGAIKYILTTTFLIPTGDDPEKEDPPEAPPKKGAVQGSETPTMTSGTVTDEQWDYITKLRAQKEIDPETEKSLDAFGGSKDPTPQQASLWIDRLKALPNKAKEFDPKTFKRAPVLAYVVKNISRVYDNPIAKANALKKYVGGENFLDATDEQVFNLGAAIKKHMDERGQK